jgi:hypothetical protein
LEGRRWMFVTGKKIHNEEGEMREGERRVDRQVIN